MRKSASLRSHTFFWFVVHRYLRHSLHSQHFPRHSHRLQYSAASLVGALTPFSVVAALLPPAQQMAKRSHTITDEASKYTGVSLQSNPEGKRVLALASAQHQKSSPLISIQEKTQADLQVQENPAQALGDRRISQVSRHAETGLEWFSNLMTQARRIQARHRVTDCISQLLPGI